MIPLKWPSSASVVPAPAPVLEITVPAGTVWVTAYPTVIAVLSPTVRVWSALASRIPTLNPLAQLPGFLAQTVTFAKTLLSYPSSS